MLLANKSVGYFSSEISFYSTKQVFPVKNKFINKRNPSQSSHSFSLKDFKIPGSTCNCYCRFGTLIPSDFSFSEEVYIQISSFFRYFISLSDHDIPNCPHPQIFPVEEVCVTLGQVGFRLIEYSYGKNFDGLGAEDLKRPIFAKATKFKENGFLFSKEMFS